MFKVSCDLGQLLTLTANIFGTDRYRQAVNGVMNGDQQTAILPALNKKCVVLLSTNTKVIRAPVDLKGALDQRRSTLNLGQI